jgi:hypothetical protein
MKTCKSKYRSAADFDLMKYDLRLPLLDAVPHENRTGAIIKGEKNLPVRQAVYARWWRQIARAAGIPDPVWSPRRPCDRGGRSRRCAEAIQNGQGEEASEGPGNDRTPPRKGRTK